MAATTRAWTIEDLDRLPDDGNTYEVVRGELFVTPPPTENHETISARLTRLLDPYVEAHGLGLVFHPHAVMRFEGSQVEPDLMVRAEKTPGRKDWTEAPIPLLIVEILSPSSRRRDPVQKRDLYMDAGVGEYWMVDPDERTITSVGAGRADVVARDTLVWHPRGASAPLTLDLAAVCDSR